MLDNATWSVDLASNDSRVRNSQGTAENVYIEDGTLVLRSQRQRVGGYEYTSGAVQACPKHAERHAEGMLSARRIRAERTLNERCCAD